MDVAEISMDSAVHGTSIVAKSILESSRIALVMVPVG